VCAEVHLEESVTAAITTSALVKSFPREKGYKALFRGLLGRQDLVTAVGGVDLEVREGELFGLLGPNGAGKTTLMKLLCTLILPTSGKASVFGHDVVRDEQKVKEMVGLVGAEERSFFWRLTGRENLQFFGALYRLPSAGLRDNIDELLEMVGLRDQADMRFQHYSTGMRQKLAIARGLLGQPRLLFVDEPTRSLDPLSARAVRRFLREKVVCSGRTMVLATHHLGEAEELCDRLAIMHRGRVLACGTIPELRGLFQKQETCLLTVEKLNNGALNGLDAIPGVFHWRYMSQEDGVWHLELKLSDRQRALPEVMRFVVQRGADVTSCTLQETPLEEIFMAAVGGQGVAK
jgi:ABC-2 type transport system ATP-binding protein